LKEKMFGYILGLFAGAFLGFVIGVHFSFSNGQTEFTWNKQPAKEETVLVPLTSY